MDFIVDDLRVALEAKPVEKVTSAHTKGLRELAAEHPRVGRKILVCLEKKIRQTSDGVLILPAEALVERLWAGELV